MDNLDEKILKAYDSINEAQLNEGKLMKKDFDSLALIMKNAKTLDDLKQNLVGWANGMNPMFNVEKFRKAAGVD